MTERLKIKAWDAADYLRAPRDGVGYLEAALEDGDPGVIAAAIGDIARAKGMTRVAVDAGVGRESLYKPMSRDGNPEFATVLRVLKALGIELHAKSVAEPSASYGGRKRRDSRSR